MGFLSDILICGAGVSGMLTARLLNKAGASVHLLDRGVPGREASWAGGGIVSPLYPWRYSDPVTALANYAQETYPTLVAELFDETGIDAEYSATGLMMLNAPDHAEALDWAAKYQRRMQALSVSEIYERESALGAGHGKALWMPDVANVRNPRLMKALFQGLRQTQGVSISECAEVTGFEQKGSIVTSALIRQGGTETRMQAKTFIIAAGAWSGCLLRRLNVEVAVQPVKGQMLLFRAASRLLSSIVLADGRYLIPRRDNHILAGSTLEYEGFDKTHTEAARISLRESAESILPALADLPVIQQWAGLRPGAPDGVPFIGRIPAYQNLYINAGHFRNGLVLAPASARLLTELVTADAPFIDPAPYDPVTRQGNS
jgi:glycine oxidase